jgi:hypothetical protein
MEEQKYKRKVSEQLVPYYSGNIKDSHPIGLVKIKRVCDGIKNPKPQNVELIELIRNAKDEAVKAELKTHLYSFTPCAIAQNARRYDNITEFTGILALDFDKLPNRQYAEEFKVALFSTYEFIFAAWLSSSGKGCRALVRIPYVKTVSEFKEHYNAIERLMSSYDGYDRAPKNCILPMFYSIDTNLLWRENPDTWEEKYVIPKPEPAKQYHSVTTNDKAYLIERFAKTAIDKIVNNGHPQLRAISYAVGGYVAAGYISEGDAVGIMENLIDSNAYLSIKPAVYKRTAGEMIRKGQNEPLHLKFNY